MNSTAPTRVSRRDARPRRAFTLIEVLVGGVIAAIIAAATASSLYGVFEARSAAAERREAFNAARSAVDRIARDIATTVRDADLRFALLRVTTVELNGKPYDELLLLQSSLEPVRGDESQPEGDRFEVQYRADADGTLQRRRDPAFDAYVDAGGVVRPVAHGLTSISIEAYDGSAWFEAWDSDRDGLPHAVRVTVAVRIGKASVTRGGREAVPDEVVARRTIAIDRVPAPAEEPEPAADAPASPGDGPNDGTAVPDADPRPDPSNPRPTPTPGPAPAPPAPPGPSGPQPRPDGDGPPRGGDRPGGGGRGAGGGA